MAPVGDGRPGAIGQVGGAPRTSAAGAESAPLPGADFLVFYGFFGFLALPD
jgi:hypothetical protein